MFRYINIVKTNIDLESMGLDADMFIELEDFGVFKPHMRIGLRYVELRQHLNGRVTCIDGYIEEHRFKMIRRSGYCD